MCRAQYAPTLPAGEAGRKSKKYHSGDGLTSPPFIFTSNHYGNSVIRTEVEAYCIRPIERLAWGV